MDYIKINSIPQIVFAHDFHTDSYDVCIEPRENFIEIAYINEGNVRFTQNGISYQSHSGDIICNLSKYDLKVESPKFHSHSTVGFVTDFEISDKFTEGYVPLNNFLSINGSGKYKAIIDKIIGNVAVAGKGNLRDAGLILGLIDGLSNESIKSIEDKVDYYNPYVKQAKIYINKNLSSMLKQEDIAEELNITPEYLCNVFKKSTGESIIHYINRIKLEKIFFIMHRERASLRSASEMFGYTDPAYVSRLYKKYYGVSISDDLKGDGIG